MMYQNDALLLTAIKKALRFNVQECGDLAAAVALGMIGYSRPTLQPQTVINVQDGSFGRYFIPTGGSICASPQIKYRRVGEAPFAHRWEISLCFAFDSVSAFDIDSGLSIAEAADVINQAVRQVIYDRRVLKEGRRPRHKIEINGGEMA